MTEQATGRFDIEIKPESAPGDALGRSSLTKPFEGGLQATSAGQMLTAYSTVKESAGYVAMERVTGTLGGRAGSFVLQHSGTMDRGRATLRVSVVPDSGTEALTGISGEMTIDANHGEHSYVLRYSLPVGDH